MTTPDDPPVEQQREELAQTVDALTDKLDVRARAHDALPRAGRLPARAQWRASSLRRRQASARCALAARCCMAHSARQVIDALLDIDHDEDFLRLQRAFMPARQREFVDVFTGRAANCGPIASRCFGGK